MEIRSGAGFETADFVKEKLGGLPSNDSTSIAGIVRVTGFTVAPPPKPAISSAKFSYCSTREEECYDETHILNYIFLLAKDDRTMTSGWRGAPYFRRYTYGRELASNPAISSKTSWGGYRRPTRVFHDNNLYLTRVH